MWEGQERSIQDYKSCNFPVDFKTAKTSGVQRNVRKGLVPNNCAGWKAVRSWIFFRDPNELKRSGSCHCFNILERVLFQHLQMQKQCCTISRHCQKIMCGGSWTEICDTSGLAKKYIEVPSFPIDQLFLSKPLQEKPQLETGLIRKQIQF